MTDRTRVVVHNYSKKQVKVYLTLGDTKGCIKDVSKIPGVTKIHKLQGWFNLGAGKNFSYTSPKGKGFNGNFTFGTPPINCPTTAWPNGVNLAEFIVNNGFQGSNAQETIDISAVYGVNAEIEFMTAKGGAWNAGVGKNNKPIKVITFKNASIGNNVGLKGVFPYGCTTCTGTAGFAPCNPAPKDAPSPIKTQATNICNVQRNSSKGGGVVEIAFWKFL